MHKNLLLAIYQTGDVIVLNSTDKLPGSEIIVFVRCEFEKESFSKQNQYYSYSLFDKNLMLIDSNAFEWKGYKCSIAKQDQWLSPFPSWNSNREMRLTISIEKNDEESAAINIVHSNHGGYAFKKLLEILIDAEQKGLEESVRMHKATI